MKITDSMGEGGEEFRCKILVLGFQGIKHTLVLFHVVCLS